jgi:hypothetical protein
MYVCIDVITANVRTEIVEGKSIALSLGGGMVLPHFRPIVIVAPTVRRERPIDRWIRVVGNPFRGVRHFIFAKHPKCLGSPPFANRTSTLLHFCNNVEIAPFFFRTRCCYLRTTVGETKKHSDRAKERWSRCCSYTLNRVHTGALLPTKIAGNILSTSPISRW